MSKIIQIQDINSSDTLKTMVEKINYNFDQIMAFGGGPKGEMGQRGFIGPDGEQGEQGERGNLITVVDDISTVGSDLKLGDIAIYSDNQYIYKVEEIDGEKHFVSTNICIKGNAGESGTSNSPFKYSEEGDAIVNSSNEKGVPKYTFIGTDTTIDGHIGNLNVVGSDGIHIFTSTDNTGNDNGYCGKIYGDKLNSENILVLKGEDNPNNNYVKIDNTLLTDKINSSNNAIKIAEITNNVIILGDKSNNTSIECNDFTIKNGSNTPIETSSSGINLKGNLYVNDNDYKYTTKICGTSIELLSDYLGVSTNIKSNNTGVTISYNKDIRKNNAVNKDKNTLKPSTHHNKAFSISSSISINDIIIIQANKTQINGNVTVGRNATVGGDATVDGNATVGGDVTAKVNNVSGVYLGCPIGTIVMWAGSTAPNGWHICDGSGIPTTENYDKINEADYNNYKDYSKLLDVLKNSGFPYGIGNENYTSVNRVPNKEGRHVNLPNLQQKFPLGAQSGKTINTGFDGNGKQDTKSTNLGQYGGDSEVTLSVKTMPSHNHTLTSVVSMAGTKGNPNFVYNGGNDKNADITLNKTGGDKAHNNMPPFLAINFIIKYK